MEPEGGGQGGAVMVSKVDGEEGVSTGLDLRPAIGTSTPTAPGRGA